MMPHAVPKPPAGAPPPRPPGRRRLDARAKGFSSRRGSTSPWRRWRPPDDRGRRRLAAPRRTPTKAASLARRLRESGVPLHETIAGDARRAARRSLAAAGRAHRRVEARRRVRAVVTGRGGTPLLVVACGVQEPGQPRRAPSHRGCGRRHRFRGHAPGGAGLTHPRAVRASMGAIFRMPAVEAALERDARRGSQSEVHGHGGGGARGRRTTTTVDWSGPVALLLGGEGAGLPAAARRRASLRVAIPMAPRRREPLGERGGGGLAVRRPRGSDGAISPPDDAQARALRVAFFGGSGGADAAGGGSAASRGGSGGGSAATARAAPPFFPPPRAA